MAEFSAAVKNSDLQVMVRFLADLQQSGCAYLLGEGWSARLGFREGRLVAASFGEERGFAALRALGMVMTRANMVYGPDMPLEDDFDMATDAVHDFLSAQAGGVALPLDAVPIRALDSTDSTPAVDRVLITRSALRLLLAIDGQHSIGEIIAEKRRALPILLDLVTLMDLGLIHIDQEVRRPDRTLTTRTISSLPAPASISNITEPIARHDDARSPRQPDQHSLRNTFQPAAYAGAANSATRAWDAPAATDTSSAEIPDTDLSDDSAEDTWFTRLLPIVSIALVMAALIAGFLVFVRPSLDALH